MYRLLEEGWGIGCGVCALNCPKDALTMVKVREFTPEPNMISQFSRMRKEARHQSETILRTANKRALSRDSSQPISWLNQRKIKVIRLNLGKGQVGDLRNEKRS